MYYSAYTATVHGMAQLRDKKDGLLNHFMGGLAVGTIYSLKGKLANGSCQASIHWRRFHLLRSNAHA